MTLCAWCLRRLSRDPGWVEIDSALHGRRITICQDCWQGAEREQIEEALGAKHAEARR